MTLWIDGNGGNNVLNGTSPGDGLNPDGIDIIKGFEGTDQLSGLGGNDELDGGAGADQINGGTGDDILFFESSLTGVTVDLIAGTGVGGDAQGDTYSSIEAVNGTAFNDTLTGNANADTDLRGLGGDDTLNGGNANDNLAGDGGGVIAGIDILNGGSGDDILNGGGLGDTLNGGVGQDWATFSALAGVGVSINLLTGRARGGEAAGDTLISIEHIFGTTAADTLVGDSGDNQLRGGSGNDLLSGGGGGDALLGDAGTDTVYYRDSASGVTINLLTNVNSGGDAQGDTLFDVENLSGSAAHGDSLTGSGQDNRLDGMGGDDTLSGAGGNDTLMGRDGRDSLSGGDGADRLLGGNGDDVLVGGVGIDQLYGGAGADLFGFTSLDGSVDRIRDWEAGDKVQISLAGFGIAGAASVESGTSAHGLEGDTFFYHTTTGRLFFHDGDTGSRSLIAVITSDPASLSLSDFSLI